MTRNRTPAASASNAADQELGLEQLPSDAFTGTHHTNAHEPDDELDRSVTLEQDMSLDELRDSLNSTITQNPDDPAFRKYTEDSVFMEEYVLVCVLPSTDPNAEKIVDVYNNGTPQRFIRGKWVKCRRKYVEVLARAKPFGVQTPEITDGNGDRTTKIDMQYGNRYPFEMKDRNRFGQAWLSRILAQP